MDEVKAPQQDLQRTVELSSSSGPDAMSPAAPNDQPEPTQAIPRLPQQPPLADDARRRQIESELAKLGVSPDEVRRLLAVDTPGAATAVTATRAPTATALVGDLMARNTAARAQAVEEAARSLPEFRESSADEVRRSEQLLRESHMLRRREKFRDAEAKCREALALAPKDAAALELLGDLLQGVARVNEAMAAYKRATQADPKRASAERKFGDLLMRQQNWGGADPEAAPKNPWVAVLLSCVLPGAGQIHNGEFVKGVFFFVADAVCAYLLFMAPWAKHGLAAGKPMIASIVASATVYISAMIDAQMVAKGGGRRRGGSSGWDV